MTMSVERSQKDCQMLNLRSDTYNTFKMSWKSVQ